MKRKLITVAIASLLSVNAYAAEGNATMDLTSHLNLSGIAGAIEDGITAGDKMLGNITDTANETISKASEAFARLASYAAGTITTSSGVEIDTRCDNIKPVAELDTCEDLGLSQETNLADHPAYYQNPNTQGGCDLSFSLPGLPDWDLSGGLNFGFSTPDLCQIANDYLSSVSGQITDSINSQLEGAFDMKADGSFAGLIDYEMGVGAETTGTQTTVGGANSNFGSAYTAPNTRYEAPSSTTYDATQEAVDSVAPERPKSAFSALYE